MPTKKDKLIRYCSECGTVGAVPEHKDSCCETSVPCYVPHNVAIQAHSGFWAAAALYEAKRVIDATNTVGLKVVDPE